MVEFIPRLGRRSADSPPNTPDDYDDSNLYTKRFPKYYTIPRLGKRMIF